MTRNHHVSAGGCCLRGPLAPAGAAAYGLSDFLAGCAGLFVNAQTVGGDLVGRGDLHAGLDRGGRARRHRDPPRARLDLYFKRLGGSTLVECTPIRLHRNPFGLRRSGERAEVMVADLTDRADRTGIRSGLIGEIATDWLHGFTDAEATLIRHNPARWLSGEDVA